MELYLNSLQSFMLKNISNMILPLLLLLPGRVCAEVNIAIVAPLSGDYQSLGQELVSGAKIAVDEINNNGGLRGERVNLVVVDDPCNDILAVSTAEMMAVNSSKADKINTVIGPFCQNSFSQLAGVYAKAGIFQIVPTSVCNYGTEVNHPGLIKMVGYCENQSLDFFRYYLAHFPDAKVALVYDSGIKSVVEIAAALQDEFGKAGKMLNIKSFNFAKYGNDYSELGEHIIDGDFEAAYILGEPKEVSKLARVLKKEDRDFRVFVNRYQSQGRYFEELGKLAHGTYFMSLPTLKDSPDFTETLVRLRLLGVEPRGLSVYSYSAVKLWQDIVNRANSFVYANMAEALPGNRFETAWGEVSFKSGNPENTVNYAIYKYEDGEYAQVY